MELKIIVLLVVGFVILSGILALILKAVLSSQSNMAIERLKRLNQDNLQREMDMKKKLDEAEAEYNKRLSRASEESAKIKEKMEQEILEMKNKIINQAEREKDDILSDARQEVADLKRELLRSLDIQALNLTAQVIAKLFSVSGENDKLITEMHSHLVSEALKQIKTARSTTILSALGDHNEIEILSPLTLTAHHKQAISELFSEMSGKHIRIKESPPQPQYLAGILIKAGNLVIDATLSNKLKQIISEVTTNPPDRRAGIQPGTQVRPEGSLSEG